jgi:hypothetical protein
MLQAVGLLQLGQQAVDAVGLFGDVFDEQQRAVKARHVRRAGE